MTNTKPAEKETTKSLHSLIIPIRSNNQLKRKIKLIANHLDIHNQNELNTLEAIYNIISKPLQLKPTSLTQEHKAQLADYLTNNISQLPITHQTQNHTITQKIPFKNNQSTQNQIISEIIHIASAEESKKLTNSAINMIINRLHKKGALIRMNGYYSLIPAFNDLESKDQIVFRFEKGL